MRDNALRRNLAGIIKAIPLGHLLGHRRKHDHIEPRRREPQKVDHQIDPAVRVQNELRLVLLRQVRVERAVVLVVHVVELRLLWPQRFLNLILVILSISSYICSLDRFLI